MLGLLLGLVVAAAIVLWLFLLWEIAWEGSIIETIPSFFSIIIITLPICLVVAPAMFMHHFFKRLFRSRLWIAGTILSICCLVAGYGYGILAAETSTW